ncbi:MAG: hypothetical protein K8W52_15465 [Deltaproteobacteria bacterium]|nr:hypothetical protein [Deltaproteobacteria bacterium]
MKNTITDPFMSELLLAARDALMDEEAQLAGAFAQRPRPRTRFQTDRHGDQMQGLAYQVYETTLCYAIFKRWLGIADDVLWDWHPKLATGRLVDLQVARPGSLYRFEAKWWARADTLDDDRAKLSQLRDSKNCLLAFWWAEEKPEYHERDAKAIVDMEARLHTLGAFATSFSTRSHPDVIPKEWYFGFAAFELS